MNKDISTIVEKLKKRNLSVLFVEDNDLILNTTKKSLSLIFKRVDTATDGLQALGLLDLYKYDLIITDINMPNYDGSQLIRDIREKCKIFPIIITTAHDKFKEIYSDQPNIIVINKPYNIVDILKAIDDFEEHGKVIIEDDVYERLEQSYIEARKVLDLMKKYKGVEDV